jgi:hypothetical protein
MSGCAWEHSLVNKLLLPTAHPAAKQSTQTTRLHCWLKQHGSCCVLVVCGPCCSAHLIVCQVAAVAVHLAAVAAELVEQLVQLMHNLLLLGIWAQAACLPHLPCQEVGMCQDRPCCCWICCWGAPAGCAVSTRQLSTPLGGCTVRGEPMCLLQLASRTAQTQPGGCQPRMPHRAGPSGCTIKRAL